jgi:uncharacterized protein (DUF433 family)
MTRDCSIISRAPEIMGGTSVFAGTRVPVQTLLDYLKAGESIDDFLDGFPTVSREQVIVLLEEATRSTIVLLGLSEETQYGQCATGLLDHVSFAEFNPSALKDLHR